MIHDKVGKYIFNDDEITSSKIRKITTPDIIFTANDDFFWFLYVYTFICMCLCAFLSFLFFYKYHSLNSNIYQVSFLKFRAIKS